MALSKNKKRQQRRNARSLSPSPAPSVASSESSQYSSAAAAVFPAPLVALYRAFEAAARTTQKQVAQNTQVGGAMHVFILFALCLGFAANVLMAAPAVPSSHPGQAWSCCLTDDSANQLVEAYLSLTSGETAFDPSVAHALLTPDFTDLSGSIASLINGGAAGPLSLDGEIFNKTSFITANAQQGDTTNIVKQMYHTCDTVIFRFEVDLQPQVVTGITIMETVVAPKRNPYPFQIKTVYAELNSAAFLVDVGGQITPPPPPPSS